MTDAERKAAWYQRNKEALREKHKAYYESNKERIRSKQSEYAASNKESLLEYQAEYRSKNRVELNAYFSERYYANKNEVLAKQAAYQKRNAEQVNKKNRIWRKANPGKVNAKTAKRRADLALRTPQWVNLKAIEAIYVEAAKQGLHVDHIIPLRGKTVSGLHVPENLRLLDALSNKRKGNSFVYEGELSCP